jgi:hypothetical protein
MGERGEKDATNTRGFCTALAGNVIGPSNRCYYIGNVFDVLLFLDPTSI